MSEILLLTFICAIAIFLAKLFFNLVTVLICAVVVFVAAMVAHWKISKEE